MIDNQLVLNGRPLPRPRPRLSFLPPFPYSSTLSIRARISSSKLAGTPSLSFYLSRLGSGARFWGTTRVLTCRLEINNGWLVAVVHACMSDLSTCYGSGIAGRGFSPTVLFTSDVYGVASSDIPPGLQYVAIVRALSSRGLTCRLCLLSRSKDVCRASRAKRTRSL